MDANLRKGQFVSGPELPGITDQWEAAKMNLGLFFEWWVWQFAVNLVAFALLWATFGVLLIIVRKMRKKRLLLSPPDYSAYVKAHIEAISKAVDIPTEIINKKWKQ